MMNVLPVRTSTLTCVLNQQCGNTTLPTPKADTPAARTAATRVTKYQSEGGGGGNDISNTTSLAQTRTGDEDAGVGTIGICAYFATTECKIEVNGVECNSCEEDWREGLYKFDCSNIDPKAGNMTMKTDDTKETTGFVDTLFEPIADIISDEEPRCTHEIPPNDNDYCFADGDGGGNNGGSNMGSSAVQIRGLGRLFVLVLSVAFLLHFRW